MRLRPLGERVTVRLDPEQSGVSSGGIFMPNRPQMFRTGVVMEVGPGCDIPTKDERRSIRYKTEVKKGERVCFPSGVFHTRQGKQLRAMLGEDEGIINERDILFVIEEGNPRIGE